MYGRSLQCLNSKIYARNAQSQPFNFQISGKSPYFQNSFFCLIEYISVSINATDAYYTSNDWKLSQLFAEPSRFKLRGLHEELEALKQFSFFPPDLTTQIPAFFTILMHKGARLYIFKLICQHFPKSYPKTPEFSRNSREISRKTQYSSKSTTL